MKQNLIKSTVFMGAFIMMLSVVGSRQNNDFPHTPTPMPSTVGPAGYIGTSGPTGTTPPGLYAPTGYDAGTGTTLPNSNALNVYPTAVTGPTGPKNNTPGVIGTTDYIVPRSNGVTGVTGLPGMHWP